MAKTKVETLKSAPRFFRSPIARGLAAGDGSPIDRTGGDYGAGLIRGFAVITRGEALGHYSWCDATFLSQVADAINAGDGVRVRFTHPDMSSDGIGRKLGRVRNGRLDGDVVRGDLHFSKTSHATPEGDLASYVMNLAEEDPDLFGASIVFEHDYEAEDEFIIDHGGFGAFESDDADNVKNLPHNRLRELRATDVVDEPAANPAGMFHATEIPAEADAVAAYALGLTDTRPEVSGLPIDPDRLRGFAVRFLHRSGLSLTPNGATPMPPEVTPPASTPAAETPATTPATPPEATPPTTPAGTPAGQGGGAADPKAEVKKELGRFTARFGAADGAAYFSADLTFEQALEKHVDKLSAENRQLSEQKAAALAAAGEATPLDGAPADAKPAANGSTTNGLSEGQARFAAGIKLPGK